MSLWSSLRDRLFGEPEFGVSAAEVVDGEAQQAEIDVSGLQERLAGRLLDDERLRGDLTDDEFQPLLDWALLATDQIAVEAASQPEGEVDQETDRAVSAIKDVVGAARDLIAAQVEQDARGREATLKLLASQIAALGMRGTGSGVNDSLHRTVERRLAAESDLSGADVAALVARVVQTATGLGASSSKEAAR